jgi:mannosyl-glycoprotein endo-beta-N-acetylglucosaminidase
MLSKQQSLVSTVNQQEIDPTYISGEYNGFEFLQLKYDGTHSTLTAAQLQTMLPATSNGNTDILYTHAQAFIDAANAYHINPFYLVAHARIETGNGTSTLANGQAYNGTLYYNMFGIGAYDGSANSSGLIAAYSSTWVTPGGVTKTGWASVDDAIEGGAYWISQHYVNSATYGQDTLYKMKWNPYGLSVGGTTHEYATGPTWACSIASIMCQYSNLMSSSGMTFSFDIPAYTN